MITCPSCGVENLDAARFCMNCATPLAAAPPLAEERKVVTTLICDLVAFTALSEAADPEDVDALLRTYSAAARRAIESHGGTVEKFVGDAVVGVFGVPAAHEDDPERAVRAGLRIVDTLQVMTRPDGSPLQVRVGINTGEALVRLDVTPGSGEGFLTGDAVNTAARLQAAAPPMGVAVGEATHDLSRRAIVYEELPPVTAKGKAEPVAEWLAKAPVARTGADAAPPDATPFVGRDMELAYLSALFDRVLSSSSPQFALLVGEPGIGKSRLVQEFSARIDARPELVTWRQGRCLPYGEGVTFWALGEIVKAHAGVLDTDTPAVADEKLGLVLPSGPDREWFGQRLHALLGLDAAKAEREENFAAWLRFLEDLAGSGPTTLVFEDLHWADDALLAFLEYVAVHACPVPLFVIATARPELLEKHPSLVAAPRVNRISLEPLSSEETTSLVTSVLGDVADEVRVGIVARAEGNPFYAEESARLAMDRARLEDIPLAGSVQAVIAARLDALPTGMKAVLTDAAAIGEVFWAGAVAVLGERSEEETDAALRGLMVKQLVHRARASTMEGEREYAFGHALARDVAYSQLPRSARAEKHAAAAEWIEAKAGDDPANLAEVLAYHYSTAIECAEAAGRHDLAQTIIEPAVRYLALAGDRARPLDLAVAERDYAQALRLAPIDHPRRPTLLLTRGDMLWEAGRNPESVEVLDEAVVALEAAGDVRGLAVAKGRLFGVLTELCDPRAADEMTAFPALLARLQAEGPSPELVNVLANWGIHLYIVGGNPRVPLEAAEQAIGMAADLGLPVPVVALQFRGSARCALGDLGGLADMDDAISAAREQGLGAELLLAMGNRAANLSCIAGAGAASEAFIEARDLARRRGHERMAHFAQGGLVESLAVMGAWDDALAEADFVMSACEAAGDLQEFWPTRSVQVIVLAWQGRAEIAAPYLEQVVAWGRGGGTFWEATYALVTSASAYRQLGQLGVAHDLLAEWAATPKPRDSSPFAWLFAEAVRTALASCDLELAGRVTAGIEPVLPVLGHTLTTTEALCAEARGELAVAAVGFAAAAAGWHDFGMPYEEGQALLGQGRCLMALGRAPEAAPAIEQSRAIFSRVGAKPALVETDGLMDRITAGSG
jgi:class 3 adenylate cyclase/tetratricopeptide (TPR) repeat protein